MNETAAAELGERLERLGFGTEHSYALEQVLPDRQRRTALAVETAVILALPGHSRFSLSCARAFQWLERTLPAELPPDGVAPRALIWTAAEAVLLLAQTLPPAEVARKRAEVAAGAVELPPEGGRLQ